MDFFTSPALFGLDAGVVLLLGTAGVLLVAAVFLLWVRLRSRRGERQDLPPLVYPLPPAHVRRAAAAASSRRQAAAGRAGEPSGERVTFNSAAPPVRIHRDRVGSENGASHQPDSPEAAEGHAAYLRVPAPAASGRPVPIAPLDPDATLQLLPGRLEPAEPGADQEIRFVRVANERRFTLGRSPAESHSHIQLKAATASRMHAYMEFEDGRWRLGNMSETNRVVVNGSPLSGDGACLLEDGDRIELGELAFVFRSR